MAKKMKRQPKAVSHEAHLAARPTDFPIPGLKAILVLRGVECQIIQTKYRHKDIKKRLERGPKTPPIPPKSQR